VCVYVVCGARGCSVDGDGEGVCVPHGVCVYPVRVGSSARWRARALGLEGLCVCVCYIILYVRAHG